MTYAFSVSKITEWNFNAHILAAEIVIILSVHIYMECTSRSLEHLIHLQLFWHALNIFLKEVMFIRFILEDFSVILIIPPSWPILNLRRSTMLKLRRGLPILKLLKRRELLGFWRRGNLTSRSKHLHSRARHRGLKKLIRLERKRKVKNFRWPKRENC